MPSAPRGKGGRGKGGGGGGVSRQDKAAPIAKESRDYKRELRSRDYGGDTIKEREEALKREVEERRLARESGQQPDLGAAGKYYERIADTSKPLDRRPFPSSSNAPQSNSSAWSSYGKANAESTADNGWAKWSQQKTWESKSDYSSQKSSSSHAPRNNWDNYTGKENQAWPQRNDTGGDSSQNGSSSHARHDNWNSHAGKENQARSDDKGWSNWKPTAASDGNQRWNEDTEQTRKVYIRNDEQESRDGATWKDKSQEARDGTTWQNTNSNWSNSREEWNESTETAAGSSTKGAAKTLDYSGRQLFREELSPLVDSWLSAGDRMETLLLHDNPGLNLDCILDLLRDPQIGVGNVSELHVDGASLSAETCWRICELCTCRRPSPAFRLCLHSYSRKECFGEGMVLLHVFKTARSYGLKVCCLDLEDQVKEEDSDLNVVSIVPKGSFQ